MDRHSIIVGLNGSPTAKAALRWSAWFSRETRAPLTVVHAYVTGAVPKLRAAEFRIATEATHRAEATGWLREALSDSPAIPFSMRLVVMEGSPEDVLLRQAHAALALVLGMTTGAAWAVHHDLAVPVVMVPAFAATGEVPAATAMAGCAVSIPVTWHPIPA
jgi:nucleotide-binding universal stress UspA family protein